MINKYTLVQHSGFGYGGHPQFEKAVEERGPLEVKDVALVAKVGGLIYNDYGAASEAAERANYPDGEYPAGGIVPKVRGSFSAKQIDGLAIYIPAAYER